MPNPLLAKSDAFGQALLDYLETGQETTYLIIRVEDGHTDDVPSSSYFQSFDEWSELDRAVTVWAKGRVLDVGVGPGRLSLYLQDKGHDVVAIDKSEKVLKVAKARGVRDARFHDILRGPLESELFQTIALFGCNIGIAGKFDNVGPFLGTLASMLSPGGRILGSGSNWNRTDNPEHLSFHELKRKAGRHPAEMVLKIAYKGLDEEFGFCLVNQDELRAIAPTVGLEVEAIIDCGGRYGFVLKKPESR